MRVLRLDRAKVPEKRQLVSEHEEGKPTNSLDNVVARATQWSEDLPATAPSPPAMLAQSSPPAVAPATLQAMALGTQCGPVPRPIRTAFMRAGGSEIVEDIDPDTQLGIQLVEWRAVTLRRITKLCLRILGFEPSRGRV